MDTIAVPPPTHTHTLPPCLSLSPYLSMSVCMSALVSSFLSIRTHNFSIIFNHIGAGVDVTIVVIFVVVGDK